MLSRGPQSKTMRLQASKWQISLRTSTELAGTLGIGQEEMLVIPSRHPKTVFESCAKE